MFPVMPGGKKPVIPKCADAKAQGLVGDELAEHALTCSRGGHGLHDATTDRSKIHAYWTRWPDANIGIPTGKASGIVSVDLDVYKADAWNQGDVEREKGQLTDTATVATGRDGLQFWYAHPEGDELPGSPENTIGPGFCVKSRGGYVVAPPSRTEGPYRTVLKTELAELPTWLIDTLREREASRPASPRGGNPQRVVEGGLIPEGSRNSALFFEALGLKDADASPAEVQDRLLDINDARCSPPLGAGEVEGIAKSACRYPVRSGNPSPEVLEAVDRLEWFWWSHTWRGMGGKTDRDVMRVLIELARRYGRLLEDGSVAVSASVRSVALAAATRYATVSDGATERLAGAGLVRKTDAGRGAAQAATWVLLPQASLPRNTQASAPIGESMPCVTDQLRPRLWDLETPAFRWTGLVKKGRAGVLYALESQGPMRLKELAGTMGWGNHRELKRRYVGPLKELGLVEERDGLLGLPEHHAERVEEVRRSPYTTVSRRRRESRDGDRTVRRVEEVENTASEVEREEKDLRVHEGQRENYRLHLASKSPEAAESCRELLNAWDRERESSEAEPAGEISELEKVGPLDPDGTIRSEAEVFEIMRGFLAGVGSAA